MLPGVDTGADIGRLEADAGPPRRAPEPATWWWGKRYLLLGVGMILSVGATLGVQQLERATSDEVTAGPGSTTTEAASDAPPAAPSDGSSGAPDAPPAAGEPDGRDPESSSATTTTTRRSTVQPTSAGQTPVTIAPGTTSATSSPPTTVPPGPPWRANPISIIPPGTVVVGQSVEFGVSVLGHGDVYQVAFGDGSSTGSASTFGCDDYSTPSSYRHTFDSPGRYTFIVRIHGSGSCATVARDFRTTTEAFTFDVVAAA